MALGKSVGNRRGPRHCAQEVPARDNVGYIVAGLFVVVWVVAVAYWRLARVERRGSSAE